MNLPDESAGQPVASQSTYDTVDNAGTPRPFLTSRHDVLGGSAEDPRWNDFNRRKTLQGQAERTAAPTSSYLRKGGR